MKNSKWLQDLLETAKKNPKWLQPLQETAHQLQMNFVKDKEMLMRKLMAPDRVTRVYNRKSKLHRITLYDPLHSVPVVFDTGGDGAAKQEEENAEPRSNSSLTIVAPAATKASVVAASTPVTSLATALPVATKASVVPSPQVSTISRFSEPSSTSVLPGLDGIDPRLAIAAAASRSSVPCKDADAAVPGAEKEREKSMWSIDGGTDAMRSSQRKSDDFLVLGGTLKKRKSSLIHAAADSESAETSSKAAEPQSVAPVAKKNADKKISLPPVGSTDRDYVRMAKLAKQMSYLAGKLSGPASKKLGRGSKKSGPDSNMSVPATKTVLLITNESNLSGKTSDPGAKTSDSAPKTVFLIADSSELNSKTFGQAARMSDPAPKMSNTDAKSSHSGGKTSNRSKVANSALRGRSSPKKSSTNNKTSLLWLAEKFGMTTG